jgi:hypothetical protein
MGDLSGWSRRRRWCWGWSWFVVALFCRECMNEKTGLVDFSSSGLWVVLLLALLLVLWLVVLWTRCAG